jgi:hypothetical protein
VRFGRRAGPLRGGIDFGQVLVPVIASHDPNQRCRATAAKERRMRNIVDEAGEIIAMASDEHTLIGGHHRLAVAASAGRQLYWKDTGELVKLDPFFKGSSRRHTA